MSWVLYRNNIRYDEKSRRETAMNAACKPHWLRGKIEVVNHATGETWERKRGSWFRQPDAAPVRRRKAAR